MLENSALAGVISSVETLSSVFKLTGTHRSCCGGSGIGRNLIFGPLTSSTFFASSNGSGLMIIESSIRYSSGSVILASSATSSPMTSSAVANVPMIAVAAALSGLTR